jgi:hypothetical protein
MWEKARNSIDPKQARTPREREHRIRQREAFWSGLRELREAPPHTLPFSISNLAKGSRTGVIIEAEKLNSLVEKWVRGIYYKIHGQPLSSAGEISVIHIHEEEAATAFGKFWEQRKFLDAGPGIQVLYLSVEEGSKRADVYVFKIWNQFEVFASADDEIANDHFGSRDGC